MSRAAEREAVRIPVDHVCDVLVAGAGIAGIMAAIEAAEAGCSVVLLSKGETFSGSSFYPGTWGLGLIGPADPSDRKDLAATIREVGCGMADPAMVETFVDGISPAIERVRGMGVRLRRAQSSEKEFIPCFDHKHRDWNGIEFASAREVFSQRMDALGITRLPHCELLELVVRDGCVCGAIAAEGDSLRCFGCKAFVLATGGYGSLFEERLCTDDVEGIGQALALHAGCTLINLEFMQMMPGYLSPAYKTIFNEKTFRFTQLSHPDGSPLLDAETEKLLVQRSTHGPFTARLGSKLVDLAIFRACLADKSGVTVRYQETLRQNPPEFVKTYFDWLAETKHLTMDDPIQIGIFAHAANGGVRIAPDGSTGVPGLFACGEATGGMHGADRIGGLSTANGLVFGGKAGRAAAVFCRQAECPPVDVLFDLWHTPAPGQPLERLRAAMTRAAMIEREEAGLAAAEQEVTEMQKGLAKMPGGAVRQVAESRRLALRFETALAILKAARLRRESRGSHYRSDFPQQDPEQAYPILVKKTDSGTTAQFQEGWQG